MSRPGARAREHASSPEEKLELVAFACAMRSAAASRCFQILKQGYIRRAAYDVCVHVVPSPWQRRAAQFHRWRSGLWRPFGRAAPHELHTHAHDSRKALTASHRDGLPLERAAVRLHADRFGSAA